MAAKSATKQLLPPTLVNNYVLIGGDVKEIESNIR